VGSAHPTILLLRMDVCEKLLAIGFWKLDCGVSEAADYISYKKLKKLARDRFKNIGLS
jgi:hypothetical protein